MYSSYQKNMFLLSHTYIAFHVFCYHIRTLHSMFFVSHVAFCFLSSHTLSHTYITCFLLSHMYITFHVFCYHIRIYIAFYVFVITLHCISCFFFCSCISCFCYHIRTLHFMFLLSHTYIAFHVFCYTYITFYVFVITYVRTLHFMFFCYHIHFMFIFV